MALLETKLQTNWQRHQQNSLNPTSLPHRKKSRPFRNRSRNQLGDGYDPQKDQINTPDRRTQTTICRLCTGHCGLRKHLKRLGLADSAHCECGPEEQTPEHILQTCPHQETPTVWAPSSWGKLPYYCGQQTSQQPDHHIEEEEASVHQGRSAWTSVRVSYILLAMHAACTHTHTHTLTYIHTHTHTYTLT